MTSPTNPLDVIVVGAGVSGLAAAQKLNQANKSYLILEARSRSGGRVWTDYTKFPVPVDFGAHWIHTFWFNPLVKLTLKHDVPLYPNEYQRGGKRLERKIIKKARVRFNYVLTSLEEGTWSDEVTIEEATKEVLLKLSPSSSSPTDEIESSIQQVVMAFMFHLVSDNSGLDLQDVKLNNWKKGEEDFDVDGGDQLPVTGMWTMFQKEFKDILPKVKHNCEVAHIDYSSESNHIRIDSNLGSFYARKVIVTAPLPIVKQKISFNPSFPPDYLKAFQSFKTGLLNCITIQFNHTFWNEDDEFLLYLPDEHPYPPSPYTTTTTIPYDYPYILLFNTFHHLLPGLITAWTYGKQAAAWEALTDQQHLSRVIGTFTKMFNQPPPAVVRYAVSRWASDPYALGSFSATELNYEEHMEVLKRPLGGEGENRRGRVVLAGEALAEKFGTVHGAYLSGIEQANKVLSILEEEDNEKTITITTKAKL